MRCIIVLKERVWLERGKACKSFFPSKVVNLFPCWIILDYYRARFFTFIVLYDIYVIAREPTSDTIAPGRNEEMNRSWRKHWSLRQIPAIPPTGIQLCEDFNAVALFKAQWGRVIRIEWEPSLNSAQDAHPRHAASHACRLLARQKGLKIMWMS